LPPVQPRFVYALGLDDRVVGVGDFCDYPPEAKTKQKVGDAFTPNIEALVSLKPDLVLTTTQVGQQHN